MNKAKPSLLAAVVVLVIAAHTPRQALEIVKDGKAVATLVMPEQPRAPAATTLISVGETLMARKAGITADALKPNEYRVQALGGALYLIGMDTLAVPDNLSLRPATPSFEFAMGRFGYNDAANVFWSKVQSIHLSSYSDEGGAL